MATGAEAVGADPRYYVETVGKAAHLLLTVADLRRPVTLAQLVSELRWNKAAVYRLVRTLDALGFLRLTADGYIPGPTLITLGQAALEATNLPQVARPHLEALAADLNETVVVTVLDGAEIVYVDRIEAEAILMTRSSVGSRLPAYCTCSGQVQLAGLADHEVIRLVADGPFEKRAPNTLTTLDALLERVADIRSQGYAINDEELAIGHRSLAVPVFDYTGHVAGALSMSVPAARVSADRILECRGRLRDAAAQVSHGLGAPHSATLASSSSAVINS
ncbi:MAG: IclR family transcriptional regulator [Acidimicrobiales bacterium]